MSRLPRLSAVLNDWTTHTVDITGGVVALRVVTPDGQHITVTLSDQQARLVGDDLIRLAESANLNRVIGERYNLACGCDTRDLDASNGDHRLSCPIRQTFS